MDKDAERTHAYFHNWNDARFALDDPWQSDLRRLSAPAIAGAVLDVGCGTTVYYDLSRATSWVGIDVAERTLDSVRFRDPPDPATFQMRRGDALELPLHAGSFDTVCMFFMLHHLGRRNRRESARRVSRALHEARRVLKPGGHLVVAENASGPLERPYIWLFPLLYPLARRMLRTELPYFWTHRQLVALVTGAGFELVSADSVSIKDWVYNPVLRVRVPPILSSDPIQKMTLFSFQRAPDAADAAGTDAAPAPGPTPGHE